jgi:predicted MPP superfamily phosphohydrolase
VDALDGTRVDLVAITGDFADHLRLAKPAIERLGSLKPKHGVFFSMGNHEYYHPKGKVRSTLDSLGVQTLVNSGTSLKIDDAILYVGGADDPARTQEDEVPFLLASTEKALNDMPSDAFNLLLSHRPRGFDAAQKFNVDLTLSGHTHGYQVGLFGQSVAESFAAGTYPRGLYQSGTSQLYTSTGLGHWFPFRLGCDREAAVIVLRRANPSA